MIVAYMLHTLVYHTVNVDIGGYISVVQLTLPKEHVLLLL
jgi:hypothetical protein